MNNPYEILGINKTATDEEVKSAYRELAKKYHPDNYADSPLSEFADEKMSEINTAFDTIMNDRRQEGYQPDPQDYSNPNPNRNTNYSDVRNMINQNRLVDAEEILDGVPLQSRDAEWYFLKGSVYYSRGWLEDAYTHFKSAVGMDSNNQEYNAALNRLEYQRRGNMGGQGAGAYRTPVSGGGTRGCSACDVCNSLICADCCCECMGGDLISCC